MWFWNNFFQSPFPLQKKVHMLCGILIFLKSNISRALVRKLKGGFCIFCHRKDFEAPSKFLGSAQHSLQTTIPEQGKGQGLGAGIAENFSNLFPKRILLLSSSRDSDSSRLVWRSGMWIWNSSPGRPWTTTFLSSLELLILKYFSKFSLGPSGSESPRNSELSGLCFRYTESGFLGKFWCTFAFKIWWLRGMRTDAFLQSS